MRAFIGIALPSAIREALGELQGELARSQADVKWVLPEQLHVTLKFLGEITELQRQAVEAMLRKMAEPEAPFQLSLEGVGAFPSIHAPRVIWVGIRAGKERVERIAHAIEREGERIRLQKDERPFAAHVTLGRVRSPQRLKPLADQLQAVVWQPLAPWRVESLTLYESRLSSSGPSYTVLADAPLKPAA